MTSQVSNSITTTFMNSIMKTTLNSVLSVKNAHPRDKNIHFEEEGHKYTILGMVGGYTYVTTWVHTKSTLSTF
jgi:hypothetical protein